MNAVGIDVSKGKSTVTIRRPGNEVLLPPCDFPHTQSCINGLIEQIKSLDGETKVCMEHTGRYYEPVASWLSDAGIFVSAVNPILIKEFGDDSLRTPKTDKADAKKIARYTLDRWANLKQYNHMDEIRNQLKTMNRQFGFYMDHKTAMKNNLIALLDQAYPGANDFFDSPARSDGSQKWVDFVHTYWHVETVALLSLKNDTPKIEVTMEVTADSNYRPKEKATYQNIKKYVKDNFGVNVHTRYIAEVKRMCGLEMGENHHKSQKENPEIKHCPPAKMMYIEDALKYFGLI